MLWVLVASVVLAGPGNVQATQEAPKQVLLLHSFGTNYSPFGEVALGFQRQLARLSSEPVEFFEASLETARFARTNAEAPLADYLSALFQESGVDLVVSIGGPAGRFAATHRERLFPGTPLLTAGLERRLLEDVPPMPYTASITLAVDFVSVIEHILHVLPDTTDIVVVMGGSAHEKFWVEELRREFERFEGRIRFHWLHELSIDEKRERISDLPPNAAIFYGLVSVDGAGVSQPHDEALQQLYAVSNAPIFGLFDNQLGRGIVGGPLLPMEETSRKAAEAALRLLSGEPTESVRSELLTTGAPVYDFRELERWDIAESALPPGSAVRFRPPSVWTEYGWPLAIGFGALSFQTALIGGLLLQRSRRRAAEEDARSLAGRLLTAHEDERRRLARELHDDLSQRLARLSIDAAGIQQAGRAADKEDLARSLRDELARLSEDVHALAYQLHPSVLHDLGLKEALRMECDRFTQRGSPSRRSSRLSTRPGSSRPTSRSVSSASLRRLCATRPAIRARARSVSP